MTDCTCGRPVRLRAYKVSVSVGGRRKTGVGHWIEHMDGSKACGGPWDCVALKPYPKVRSQRESQRLLDKWEQVAAKPPATVAEGAEQ